MIKNVLFDLDGTLTDPAEGIVRSIQHALHSLQIGCPPAEELTRYIGPPLRETFALICNSTDARFLEQAIAVFRERFSAIGLFENKPYPDVDHMLVQLKSDGYQLFVATSKPQVFAARILEHFSLADYFVEIHGNDLEGKLDDKADLLRELLVRRSLDPTETLMVGDRRHDVIAARNNRIIALGVTYGYGSREELIAAGAHCICHSPQEITAQVLDLSYNNLADSVTL